MILDSKQPKLYDTTGEKFSDCHGEFYHTVFFRRNLDDFNHHHHHHHHHVVLWQRSFCRTVSYHVNLGRCLGGKISENREKLRIKPDENRHEKIEEKGEDEERGEEEHAKTKAELRNRSRLLFPASSPKPAKQKRGRHHKVIPIPAPGKN